MAAVDHAGPADAAGDWVPTRVAFLILAPLSVAAAAIAAADGWDGGVGGRVAWTCLTLVWAVAGATLLLRQGSERLGMLAIWLSLLAGVVALAAALARDQPGGDAATLVGALAIALLPAATMHVLLALPDGSLVTDEGPLAVGAGYLVATGIGVLVWAQRPGIPTWPVVIEAAVAAGVGVNGVASRYRHARPAERRRMDAAVLSLTAAVEILLVGLTLHVLVGWPARLLELAAAATIPIPLGLLLERSRRLQGAAQRLLVHAISLAGLTALVATVFLLVVGWLGHAPTHEQRTLLVLSIVATAVTAVVYVPVKRRLAVYANQLVHGSRQAPDEVIRSFGTHLSRAVPLEDVLLQLAESLRSALALEAAEIWTGSGGMLDRVASDPERDPARLVLAAAEEPVVARAGVSGPAWMAVWLPQLLENRGDAVLRVAPISYAGELYGLVVVERTAESPPFDDKVEEVLAELARQVGLALRNVRLDSELQASLDELRQQADELRASRARVVAAADAERRRIERDLHDGAQQYLAGAAVNLGVARRLADSDPDKAKAILDELRTSAQEALEAFRDLAHGIYPPLLQDRGLAEALGNAARRAPVPTGVEVAALRRYEPEVEATVYFCCLEALQNAGKHAGEGVRATVHVWEEAGGLLFEVADDGSGFVPQDGTRGTGLTNMRDRLGAIGGSLRIESAAGRGTKLIGTIPLYS
jgi:signal transduction histidine kinase